MLLSTLLFSERVVTKNGNDGRTSAPIRNVSIRRPGTQVSARLGVTATSACCISGLMNRAISITSCTMKKQRCSSLASSRTVTGTKSSLRQAFPPGPHGGTCLNNYFPLLRGKTVNVFHQLIHPLIPFRAIAGRESVRQPFHFPQQGQTGDPDGSPEDRGGIHLEKIPLHFSPGGETKTASGVN